MSSKEKKITLKYNDYEIDLKIKNNYEEARNTIKKKLYFQDKDLAKLELYYIDDDNDENNIDIDTFEEAFNSSVWAIRRFDENPQPVPQSEPQKKTVDKEEIGKKVKKAQEDINKKLKK